MCNSLDVSTPRHSPWIWIVNFGLLYVSRSALFSTSVLSFYIDVVLTLSVTTVLSHAWAKRHEQWQSEFKFECSCEIYFRGNIMDCLKKFQPYLIQVKHCKILSMTVQPIDMFHMHILLIEHIGQYIRKNALCIVFPAYEYELIYDDN